MDSIISIEKKCFVCGTTHMLESHHILGASNRKWSEKYGLKIWLCHNHHQGKTSPHQDRAFDLLLKSMAQKAFNKHYPDEDFIKVFGRNYL